jgi:hypothetical protein
VTALDDPETFAITNVPYISCTMEYPLKLVGLVGLGDKADED